MTKAKTEKEWADCAKRFLKGKLKHADITYGKLAELLKKEGINETGISIASKLSRGTFPATFFLATLSAIDLKEFRMEDL